MSDWNQTEQAHPYLLKIKPNRNHLGRVGSIGMTLGLCPVCNRTQPNTERRLEDVRESLNRGVFIGFVYKIRGRQILFIGYIDLQITIMNDQLTVRVCIVI